MGRGPCGIHRLQGRAGAEEVHDRPRQDQAAAQARKQHHEQRDDGIELLFDGQRPGHQKWNEFALGVEVPGAMPEEKI